MIQDKAMLVSLKISMIGMSKKDKEVTETANNQYNAEKDAGSYSKSLIAREDIANVKHVAGKARKFHTDQTLSWSDNNERILPSKNYLEYSNGLSDLKAEFETAVSIFADKYQDMIAKQQTKMGSMFDIDDYIAQSEVVDEFSFEYQIMPVPSADDFRLSLSDDEVKEIKANITKAESERTKAAMSALWERVYNNITNMETQLGKENGKIYNTLLSNTIDLVKLLDKLNITDDPELERVRKEIGDRLCVFEVNELRKKPEIRKEAMGAAKEIRKDIANVMGIAV